MNAPHGPLRGYLLAGPVLMLLVGLVCSSACTTVEPKPEDGLTEGEADAGPVTVPEGPTPDIPERPQVVTEPKAEPKPAPKADPEADKRSAEKLQDAFQDGMRAAQTGNADQAITEFKAAATDDPRSFWVHYNLGVLYERKGDNAAAERAYLKSIDLQIKSGAKPKVDRASENYAKLMVRVGKAVQAEAELKRRIEVAPDALGLRYALAWALLAQDKLDEGAAECKKVLKFDEQNVSAMFVLANIYFKQKRPELAMMVLDNAGRLDMSRAEIPNLQGVILLSQKKKTVAMDKFRTAASLREDFPEAHNNLGMMLLAAQNFQDAVRELEMAVKYAPGFAAAHLNLGNAYRGVGDVERAKAEYAKALKLDPALGPDVYFNYGVLYLDADMKDVDVTKRMEEALAYFAKVKEAGRGDDSVEQYIKDANKAIEREKRRKEREEKDKIRKQKKAEDDARKAAEAEAKKKADEEKAKLEAEKAKADAEQKAIEDAKKQAEADEKARLAAEKQAAADAKKQAAADAKAKVEAEKKAAAEEKARLAAEKKAADDAKKQAAAEEKARLAAEKKAADEAKKAAAKRATKLGDDDDGAPAPQPAKPAGKLGDDEAAPSKPAGTQGKIGDD